MITSLTKDKNSVIIDSDLEVQSTSFGIHDMAKAFHAITTQVYKNPEFSVIAEICANAWDSHILAKKQNIPFNIHLPNNLEPWFSVRDFGIGMDHNFMLEKYTQAFLSTKDNTNRQNGAFGIGRLTCLALNDTYSVICYKGGIKRIYSVFKEDSCPKIIMLSTEPTEEQNGVEVSVNIDNRYSYLTFSENAAKILSFYPIKMIVSGAANFTYTLPEYDLRVNDKDLNFGFPKGDRQSYAIMGVYAYPIDSQSLDNLTDAEYKILNKGIHIFVKLGDCSVSLSRDGLFYDGKTKKRIKDEIAKIATHYVDLIKKQIENAPNFLAAKKLYWDNFSHNGDCYYLTQTKNPEVSWKGVKFNDFHIEIPANSKVKCDNVEVEEKRTYLNDTKKILINDRIVFFVNDLDKKVGIKSRLKHYYNQGGGYGKTIYLFDNLDKEFLDYCGLKESDFSSLKAIVPPPSQKTYNYDRSKCKVFIYDGSGYRSDKSSYWKIPEDFDETDIEDADDAIFVTLEGRFYASNKYNHNAFWLLSKLRDLNPKLPKLPVYGIRYKYPEIIESAKKVWKSLDDYIYQEFDNLIKQSSNEIKQYVFESNVKKTKFNSDGTCLNNLSHFESYNPLIQNYFCLKNKLNAKLDSSKVKQLIDFAVDIDYKIDANSKSESKICDKIIELKSLIEKQYPILGAVSIETTWEYNRGYVIKNKKVIEDYLADCDAKNPPIEIDQAEISAIMEDNKVEK